MTKYRQILNLISVIRDSHPTMVEIFTKGSCLNFHLILRSVYPEAEPYYDQNHIITKIDNYYYDITGVVNPKGYLRYDGMGFSQMLKVNHLII